MRTRSRVLSVYANPPSNVPVERRKWSVVEQPPPKSPYFGAPLVRDTPTVSNQSVGFPLELLQDTDQITDEVDVDRRLKYCDHIKRRCGRLVPPRSPDEAFGTTVRTDGDHIFQGWRWKGIVSQNYLPLKAAWIAAMSGSVSSMTNVNEGLLRAALGSVPKSRLGELPGRVVRAIEEWNATTTLIEARDLPELYSLVSKRGPLGGVANAIIQYRRSLTDMCSRYRSSSTRETVRRLLAAYRSGHLGYAFGLMPTVSDVTTISDILSRGVKARKSRIIRTLQGKVEWRKLANSGSGTKPYYGRWDRTEDIDMLRVDGVCVDLKRPMISSNLDNYVKRLVGVNGARLIWDVLPFSFVADWFLSVDDALDALWLGSQTEYDVNYWSSTKIHYGREVSMYTLEDAEFKSSPYPMVKCPNPLRVDWTHYTRSQVPPPRAIETLRYRAGPRQIWLTALLGLGLVPRRLQSLIISDR